MPHEAGAGRSTPAPLKAQTPFALRRPSAHDAECLSVLAMQVWLHTYATQGITQNIACYVREHLSASHYRARLAEPNCHIWVAQCGAGLAGFALLQLDSACPVGGQPSAQLQTLYVQAPFVGQGLGKALLQAAQAQAEQSMQTSGSALWLTVNAQNANAIAFYARQGYVQVGSSDFVMGQERHLNHVLIGPAPSTSRTAERDRE